jgi:hypothetical protein
MPCEEFYFALLQWQDQHISNDWVSNAVTHLTDLREITDSDLSDLTPSVQNEGYCLKLYHERFLLHVSVQSSDDIHYSGFRQHNLRTDISLFLFPVAPTFEYRASVKRFVSLQFLNPKTVGGSPWTGDQPIARALPIRTQNKHKIHALSGIRTHDPRIRAGEDSSCLRPRGHCDRLRIDIHRLKVYILFPPFRHHQAVHKYP